MKKLMKKYIQLYTKIDKDGELELRWDRIKHAFSGDVVSVFVFLVIGNWNNFGANEHFNSHTMWWFYYLILPLLAAFLVGILKEVSDKYIKKSKFGFDWGDVWATTIPWLGVYQLMSKVVIPLFFPNAVKELEK